MTKPSAVRIKPEPTPRGVDRVEVCGLGLVEAVFQQQPATWQQMMWRAMDDLSQRAQAIATRGQGLHWLVAERRQVRVSSGDVRWIAEHEMESAARQRCPP